MEELKPKSADSDIQANKTAAALSYLWLLALVILFLKRDSKFAQFHAKQGLILFILEVVAWFIFFIPFIGTLLWLGIVILAVVGITNALNGRWAKLPLIGQFAEKINL
jgi:uncharacterized membrane protein